MSLAVLFVLTAVLGNMSVELPFSVSLSLMFASVCAGVFYAGPWGGGLMALAGAVSIQEIRTRKPLALVLVNFAQLFISGLLSGWVLATLGEPVSNLGAVQPSIAVSLVAPMLSVVTFYCLNLLLVGLALSIKTGMSRSDVSRVLNPGAYLVSMLILALLGYVIAHLMAVQAWLGLVILVLPFAMARRTFRVYVELTEAYTSTVRSLVSAIEAKDPYTKGHSERVSDYTRGIARKMTLTKSESDLLERAALLHDVGKIGVSLDALMAPRDLSPDEVWAVRCHPALGSDLVADVEFLTDIVGVIRHHHERLDGTGYPDGLAGDEIPLLARILAVADSYDAMTSNRAYRTALRPEDAREELQRVAGTQLDRHVVEHFLNALAEDANTAVTT